MCCRDYTPTRREREVLRAIYEMGTLAGAARALYVSSETVKDHLDHLRQRTGLHYLPQLTGWAGMNGWLSDE